MDYEGLNNTLDRILINLREILSSVREEQKLIGEHDLIKISDLVDQRLDILANYEDNFLQLVAYMSCSTALNQEYDDQLDFLTALSGIIPIDEVSIHYTLDQAKSLIEEIQNQNIITSAFLELEPLHLEHRRPKNLLQVTDNQYHQKKKPIELQLAEEEETGEGV